MKLPDELAILIVLAVVWMILLRRVPLLIKVFLGLLFLGFFFPRDPVAGFFLGMALNNMGLLLVAGLMWIVYRTVRR